jgi:hypothetical protein
MDARQSVKDEGPNRCGYGATLADRFRRTISDLEKSWGSETARTPFYPFITWTRDGPLLGAATLLARHGRSEDDRLLALLSVAHARDVPAAALKHLVWAEREFHRGNLVKSAMHVALTGLPALVGREAARRLHMAAGILDHGFLTSLGLMKACGFDCSALDALVKYSDDQPRVPKGNPDGGQWTGDGTGAPPQTSVSQIIPEPPFIDGLPPAAEPGPPASAPVGSSRSPIEIQPRTNQPATIDSTPFSGHALDQMQGRGLPPSAVTDTILNGQTSPGNKPGTTAHYSPANNVTVITDDATGNVITAHKGHP